MKPLSIAILVLGVLVAFLVGIRAHNVGHSVQEMVGQCILCLVAAGCLILVVRIIRTVFKKFWGALIVVALMVIVWFLFVAVGKYRP